MAFHSEQGWGTDRPFGALAGVVEDDEAVVEQCSPRPAQEEAMNSSGCVTTYSVRSDRRRSVTPHQVRGVSLRARVTVDVNRKQRVEYSQTSWLFEAALASVPAARHSVGAQARRWGFAEESTAAELLITEVVTNALGHTSEPIQVRMSNGNSVLRMEVEEHGSSAPLPPARLPGPEAESGRGLFLLEALSQEWGVDRTATGKIVWFEIAVSSSSPVSHCGHRSRRQPEASSRAAVFSFGRLRMDTSAPSP
ncbi:anti-sigma regulatory factor (Ser/Thr protein kinase) [Nonomuraea thailandensis]|uniref:Anti-sigma regulatory factor (Ser/Thr protein kinase) n=1 Tax=Nonomuraea thailandensis TaxID=1188745 RepID=A0A9X2K0Z1_9ACTN|nr:ATP-binding protein [Nonomuraea thailandensis]MCP2352991.1 anti-sigma regulatory factor (Ser/Thr protein kinase) [Nonomuraea thailandensis]